MSHRIISNRVEMAGALLDIIRPLKEYFSPHHAWLHVGNAGVHYGEKASRMEGAARLLWGLGPLWAGEDSLPEQMKEEAVQWRDWYIQGIVCGTNPDDEEYWGDIEDYDQKMVELAALVTAISLNPETIWRPLPECRKEQIYVYLNQINNKEVHANNWRYFRILVNMTFRLLGLTWSKECMDKDWDVIEGCYTGDGWYYDGNAGQIDYYIPFAMQYYALIYGKFMDEIEPERCRCLKERAGQFAKDFVYWFANDGNEIPFGRSLTYRFAHSAPFSALAFAEVDDVDYGIMKHLMLKNLELWMNRPIFDTAGILTVGYGYPNLFMSERYNGPGSPYWSMKIFLALALPETHPFWQAEEKEISYESRKLLSHPHMLITHGENNHVITYTAGQHCRNHGHCPEKYEKFAYSNQFGFSISRETGLMEGAFDSTIAFAEAGENVYRMRYGADAYEVNEQAVKVKYRPMQGVQVESIVIPLGSWHVRVHRIETDRAIDIADGGFSIEAEKCFSVVSGRSSGKYTREQIFESEQSVFAYLPWGVSGVVSLTGGKPEMVDCFPNTNLLYNLTILPTVRQTLQPGQHVLITCVFADRSDAARDKSSNVPGVKVTEEEIQVQFGQTWIKERFMQLS